MIYRYGAKSSYVLLSNMMFLTIDKYMYAMEEVG